jgi:EAL domain-containing protein (putative c-di-GMP-specific phosphodiesterase class I)
VIELRMMEDWTHQRGISIERSCLGIIYLSWDAWNGHGYDGLFQTHPELAASWKEFAEAEGAKVFQGIRVQAVLHWRENDLFVSVKLRSGNRSSLDNSLKELALDIKRLWETAFLERSGMRQGCLRVGASVSELEGAGDDERRWYEAVKNAVVQGQSDIDLERSFKRRAFGKLLENREVYPVYQPIVSLEGGQVFGYEALTRLKDRRLFDGPQELFEFAEKEGQVYALDRVARELAIDGCTELKAGQKLFINVMAQIMEDPDFSPGQTISLLEQHRLSPHHVVFEITERSAIADYPAVKKALQHYRNQGYQIAIDDVGAGYSSLQSIVELHPDFIKVDRSIVQDIHRNEMKEHVMGTLLDIGGKMGVSLIAEGIEVEGELKKLAQMGVHYAQGYWIGRPAPFPV